jgi:hypothetical protein
LLVFFFSQYRDAKVEASRFVKDMTGCPCLLDAGYAAEIKATGGKRIDTVTPPLYKAVLHSPKEDSQCQPLAWLGSIRPCQQPMQNPHLKIRQMSLQGYFCMENYKYSIFLFLWSKLWVGSSPLSRLGIVIHFPV